MRVRGLAAATGLGVVVAACAAGEATTGMRGIRGSSDGGDGLDATTDDVDVTGTSTGGGSSSGGTSSGFVSGDDSSPGDDSGAVVSGASSSGGASSSSGTGSSSSSSSSSGGTSSSGSSSSGSSSGTGGTCVPLTPSGALPFAVDSAFIASGYEGDIAAVTETGVTGAGANCNGNRATGSGMLGKCHTFNYGAVAAVAGWAGVVWQYPLNNWGTSQGFGIPAGATKVSFWVRGAAGGEKVSFTAGGIAYGSAPSPTDPCPDTVKASSPKLTLTTAWQHVTMTLAGGSYPTGVIGGFAFAAAAVDQPVPGTAVTFYIDDIEWQM